jgi:hypothetical protein
MIGRIGMVAAFLMVMSPAHSLFDSGNDLLRFCTSDDALDQGICSGLISGYFENLHFAYECNGEPPKTMTRRQLVDMVVKRLRDDPGKRHLPASVIASAVFVDAFNCSWVGHSQK